MFLVAGLSVAVKNITITLPEAVVQGDSVTLRCDYDLEDQNLYSIKWFRDESEFYQFVPKEIPATKVFDVDGVKIKVDVSATTSICIFSVAGVSNLGVFSVASNADTKKSSFFSFKMENIVVHS